MIDVTKQRFKYKHTVPYSDPNNEEFAYWIGFLYLDNTFKDVSVCKSPWKGYSVRTSGRKAKFVAGIIYKDANIALDRKKNLVEEYCG